jgi:hypothetical protein
MNISTLRLALVLMVGTAIGSGQEAFDMKVERVRVLRKTRGALHVDIHGVTFRSDDGKTEIQIPLENLRRVEVADPAALHFELFDVDKWKPLERREYTFRAPADAPVAALARFFAAHTARPVSGHYAESSLFRIPAYHRRRLAGTYGMLEIGPESIQYVSKSASDSRTWLYRDIETIGHPDVLQFRVTAGKETYVLELQERMPEAAYDLAWNSIYGMGGR